LLALPENHPDASQIITEGLSTVDNFSACLVFIAILSKVVDRETFHASKTRSDLLTNFAFKHLESSNYLKNSNTWWTLSFLGIEAYSQILSRSASLADKNEGRKALHYFLKGYANSHDKQMSPEECIAYLKCFTIHPELRAPIDPSIYQYLFLKC